MLRHLIVMRHAKSSWKANVMGDHARPLNGRGRRDAPRMAEALILRDWWPEVVVSSDAQRTRETWALMAQMGSERAVVTPQVHFERGLYLAGFDDLALESSSWETAWQRVLVLGHNPGWQQLVGRLCGTYQEMTTANAALLVGEGDSWRDALQGHWRLEAFLRPKELVALEES